MLNSEPSVVDCGQALKSLHAEETLRVVSRPPSTSQKANQGWRPPRHGGGEPVAPLKVTTGKHVNRLSPLFYNPDS